MRTKNRRRFNYAIPRGIIYHKVYFDIVSLFRSFFSKLSEPEIVTIFEKKFAKYMGRKHAIAFSLARTAIYYSLKARGIPAGSEIIMPPITIKGILDVVLDLGLKPIFVDIDLNTLCFNTQQLECQINSKTKAILITYLFGIVPNMVDIITLCKRNDIFILEDFSQCLNGEYAGKKTGCFGGVGIYSTSSIKTLDTYGGGLLVCDDNSLYQKIKTMKLELCPPSRTHLIQKVFISLIRNIATTRPVFHWLVFPLLKVINILKPDSMMKHTGSRNQKMVDHLPEMWFERYTSFQAKVGLGLLSGVREGDSKRKKNVIFLKSKIVNMRAPMKLSNAQNVYWQFIVFFNNPTKVQSIMHKSGIDTSTTSLEIISSLSEYPCQLKTPNAKFLYDNGLFIPSFPGLSQKDLEHIANIVNEASKIDRNEKNCNHW